MEYEYIIVGSGVAGTTVAKKLLEKDPETKILMLEAGPKTTLKDRRLWWDYVNTGVHPYAKDSEDATNTINTEQSSGSVGMEIKGSRLLGFGGSTVHWGGWSLRLKPEDFLLKTNTGIGIDWPIQYDDLKEYYEKAESYLGVCGTDDPKQDLKYPLPPFPYAPSDANMIEGFKKLDWHYTTMPLARFRKCMQTGTCKYCPIGARFTAAYVMDDLIDSRPYKNLVVRCNSPVRKLNFDGGRVVSVQIFDRTTERVTVESADRIILACGTIETPKLLLASNAPNEYQQIGKNFIVHPFLLCNGKLKAQDGQKPNPGLLQQEYDFPTLMSRQFDSEKFQKQGKLFMFKSRSKPRTKLHQQMEKGKTKEQINDTIEGSATYEIQAFMEDFPSPDNYVTLIPGKYDRFGLPLSKVHYSRDDEFEKRKENWLDLMESLLVAMDVEPEGRKIRSPRADHAGGTCRMSLDKKDGVVDPNLKLWDVDNLYVISNAVFPNLGAVNPTLTLTALSLRLSEHLISN